MALASSPAQVHPVGALPSPRPAGLDTRRRQSATAPSPPPPPPPRYPQLQLFLLSAFQAWERWQVSHHGRYTEARLRALAVYSKRASPLRVLAVLVAVPLPILCFVSGLECFPLADPARGWHANTVWWTRHALCLVLVAAGCILQLRTLVPGARFTAAESLAIVAATNAGYVGFLLGLASAWVFPIPFVFALTGSLFSALLLCLCALALELRRLGSRRLSAGAAALGADDAKRFSAFTLLITIEVLLMAIYPAFERSFLLVSGRLQLLFPVMLVAIKFALKHLLALAIRRGRFETQLPELVVFTVELFHALYLTACFTARSFTIWWMAAMVALDLLQSLSSAYALLRHATSVQQLFGFKGAIAKQSSLLDNAVDAIASNQARRGPSAAVLRSFGTIKRFFTARVGSGALAAIVSATARAKVASDRSSSRRPRHMSCSRLILAQQTEETLRVFSKSEYFVFVEYVECVIPLMYAAFHALLARQPNVQYYRSSPAAAGGIDSLLVNVALFVGIKVASLVGFSLFLRWRLQFFVLHQLAFALEAEMVNIQAKFAIFIPYCLFFFLAHNALSASWD